MVYEGYLKILEACCKHYSVDIFTTLGRIIFGWLDGKRIIYIFPVFFSGRGVIKVKVKGDLLVVTVGLIVFS